ncbi:MAG: hypothetical protein RR446_06370 [Lachnospiraceae bacterium]
MGLMDRDYMYEDGSPKKNNSDNRKQNKGKPRSVTILKVLVFMVFILFVLHQIGLL